MPRRLLCGLAWLLCLTLLLFAAGCNPDSGNTSSESVSSEQTDTQKTNDNAVNFVKSIPFRPEAERGVWEKRADLTHSFMRENFFGKYDMYQNTYPYSETQNRQFHYWIQAQVLDSIVDAYIRSGDKQYAQNAKDLIEAIRIRNGRFLITNDFYDDMGWLANAILKLYIATGDEDLWPDIEYLTNDILSGWNSGFGGGIAWNKNQPQYKNSPSNGPACILTARLYQVTGKKEYLDWALKIFEWWDSTLVDHETGLVWDGINRQNDSQIDKDWRFTYCQGVYIGSCVELYRITKDETYIDKAIKTADYTINNLVNKDGILQDEGSGDGGAFKGIFCRYFVQLIKTTERNRKEYCDFLVKNGNVMWSNIQDENTPIFNTSWSSRPRRGVTLQTQSSGLALLESLADLYKNGYISDPQ
ncbi:MAG TPA: glycosyl hydrolase [Clostridiales bacterium]|nr:glycosyl hydrolase [Clostridiales bacterium]